ncbi:MAG: hypothetical protein ICV69_08370 [Thermoleophilaceae bacterium]|nr:hypothetical protein [Thermoleophilaceae bacterium]
MTLRTARSRRADLPPGARRPHPLVAAVFAALERAGVRWALLRGEGRLAAPPHDVDLLVDPADVASLADAVRPLGFLPVPTWDKGSHRFFVARAPSLGRWVILDVVTELCYGPAYALRSGAAAGCLARREAVGSLALLTPDDAFWTLLLHCILNRGDFPEHQRERLRALCPAARPHSELGLFASSICAEGWDAERLLMGVRAERWAALSALSDDLVRTWRQRHPAAFALRRGLAIVSRRTSPLHTLLRRRGLAAALVGDDDGRARAVATVAARDFYYPTRVIGVPRPAGARARDARRAVARSAVVRFHQGRGRLVILVYPPTAAPGDGDVRLPPPRPDLLLLVSERDGSRHSPAAPDRACRPLAGGHRVERQVIDVSTDSCASEAVLQALWEGHGRRGGYGRRAKRGGQGRHASKSWKGRRFPPTKKVGTA